VTTDVLARLEVEGKVGHVPAFCFQALLSPGKLPDFAIIAGHQAFENVGL
jgi:hypothetical protein